LERRPSNLKQSLLRRLRSRALRRQRSSAQCLEISLDVKPVRGPRSPLV
jgi:hypothetical protein